MNLMCVEPVINTGDIIAFTSFSPEGEFRIHQITTATSPNTARTLNSEKFLHFCYDAFKVLDTFGPRSPFLWDVKILYELLGHKSESLIGLGKDILGFGPMEKYVDLSEQVKAHINSYKQTKIDIMAHQAVQLLPEDLLNDLYLERAKVIKTLYLRLTDEDKGFYKKFYSSVLVLHHISSDALNIDLDSIKEDMSHSAVAVRRYAPDGKAKLKFSAVGAKTGRLGFRKNSLNLYILPRETRKCIVPKKDHTLVEIDFKSFQPRLAIFSTGNEEFESIFRTVDDIYSVFPGDRKKNKIAFLAWMYATKRIPNEVFDKYAWPVWELRRALAKKCKEQGFLKTKWGRKLYYKDESDHVIFQNFITATEVDCILQLTKDFVDMGIKVLFPFHDAVICEVPNEHLYLIEHAREYSQKFLGKTFGAQFPVGVSIGNNFGNMNAVSMEKVQKA